MSAFSIFKDKKKQKKQQTPTAEVYYTRLANRAKIGMFAVIIALISFCLLSYSFYPEELTVENFRYLLKFISFEQNEDVEVGSVISFDTDPTNKYAIVRGDIAVLSKSQGGRNCSIAGVRRDMVRSRHHRHCRIPAISLSRTLR